MANPLLNYIGLKKETAFGTPVSVDKYLKINESDGIQINNDIQYVESILAGVHAKNKEAFKGKIEISGGYELPLTPQYPVLILYSALGGLNTTTIETGVYKHTLTEQLTKPSLSVEQKIGEIVKKFAGFRVSNFSIEGKAGEMFTLSFEGMAKNQADATETTPVYESHRVLNFADVSYVKIGGTDFKGKIEEMSIEYNNNLEPFYSLGSNTLQESYSKPSEIGGKFTMYLDSVSKQIFDDMVAGQTRDIEILINGDTLGNTNFSIKIIIPKAIFESSESKISTDYNALDVEFQGIYDNTNGLVKIEVVNDISSY
jgi:hypothetical protein